jgi:DNA (cytosine-5)-methyltransferase 1
LKGGHECAPCEFSSPFALEDGLIVDLFAGGGGASLGIEAALKRHVDIAINHDPIAIAVHAANHPKTKHYTSNIWEVDPLEATGGRPVLFLHASPDCTHFSRAKGDVPRKRRTSDRSPTS